MDTAVSDAPADTLVVDAEAVTAPVVAAAPTEELAGREVQETKVEPAKDETMADGAADVKAETGSSVPKQEPEGNSRKRTREHGVKLGYKTFETRDQCVEFFRNILSSYETGVFLNEYEYLTVLDLLLKGHPRGHEKVGCGLQGIQIRVFRGGDRGHGDKQSLAFYAVRKDGSVDDFSYLKCCQTLFPGGPSFNHPHKRGGHNQSPGHSRGRGGRGRGRGGRGGRGRGGRRGRH